MFSLLSSLTSNVKLIVGAVILAIVLAVIGTFAWKYNSALNEIKETQNKNVTLEKEKSVLAQANTVNQKTIEDMKTDLAAKEKTVTDFRIQKARDDKKISDFQEIIRSYSSDKDGPISIVLKDTVREIQKDREGRLK